MVNESGEVISLVSPDVGPGPFSAVLEGNFTTGLDVHQPIALDSSRHILTVGPLLVDFRESDMWQPRPDWSRLQGVDIHRWASAAALPADIDQYLKLTIDGMMIDDSSMYSAGVEGLVGRGGGLTPMGDDVLMGVLYGLWVWYLDDLGRPPRKWMEMVQETAVLRTTTLSANFICAAASGEATWQWHDLVHGRPHAVDRILSIGHTSGADAWAGFIYTGSVLSAALSRNAG